jgi:cytochrome bd-type quinol oxidase subunit 2
MEKVAWTEFLVSVAAIVVVSVLFPWLGSKAHAGFGLLGLLACSAWFVRRRGQTVVIDERDRAIERRATQLGVHAAWMALFVALIVLVLWSSYFNEKVVATRLLTWLIWIQFAICYGVKGLVAVLAYRRQRFAT